MSKSKSKSRAKSNPQARPVSGKSSSKAKRKNATQIPQWAWVVGGIVGVGVLILIGTLILGKRPVSLENVRPYEALAGVTGVSYDDGPTTYRYPDPAGQGAGRKWLPSLGDENAPVVVIEYSDLYCPHCRLFTDRDIKN